GGVRRFSGGDFVEHEFLVISREAFGRLGTWSSIVAVTMGVPEIGIESSGVVGDVATATADFRDEYYGLVGKLVEDSEIGGCDDRDGSPAVLTTGLVDLGVSYWGKKATRIHKRKWEGPRVAAAGIVGDARLSKWVDARRVEKVVVATQTKVVEAFVDFSGEYVVLTPMISVMVRGGDDIGEGEDMEKPKTASPWHPGGEDTACRRRSSRGTQKRREDMQEPKTAPAWHPESKPDCAEDGESGHPHPEKIKDRVDVWMVGAAIGSPVCSAFAMREFGGAAMHADALKMSARQVLELPLPGDLGLWEEGALLFERVHGAGGKTKEKTPSDRFAATSPGSPGEEVKSGYEAAVIEFGEVMCLEYGVGGDDLEGLMGWWLGRLGIG
ncbi:MAG: hypothetical protein JKY43_05165, partial [Phycisphaerales bacterium]|nr:hypothetical protein [Phycisphaerales bacterium]